MATFVIYADDYKYLDKTIDGLIDSTPKSFIDEIIVCDDNNISYQRENITVKKTDRIGRAKAWNNAARSISTGQLIFLSQAVKFSNGWVIPIVDELKSNKKTIVTPIVHELDVALWSMTPKCTRKFGWRWDFKQYDRIAKSAYSPSASHSCLAINKSQLVDIGGFDDNMLRGDGECLELSIRNWLFGGVVKSVDSIIGSYIIEDENIHNLARIAEVWFPAFANNFYKVRGIDPISVKVGDLTNLVDLQDKQQITSDGYLSAQLPELLNIFKLFNSCSGKNIAIVADGPSIDKINPAFIYRNDLIIAIDYMGMRFDSDYVMTTSAEIVTQLKQWYVADKMVLPTILESKAVGNLVNTNDVISGAYLYESCVVNDPVFGVFPPFANFGSVIHNAVNFAVFLGGSSITLYGCDNKIINGKSHSAIKYYNDGVLWNDSEATRSRFAGFEYGLDRLGRLATDNGMVLLRLNHA